MHEAGFLEQKSGSPTGLALVVAGSCGGARRAGAGQGTGRSSSRFDRTDGDRLRSDPPPPPPEPPPPEPAAATAAARRIDHGPPIVDPTADPIGPIAPPIAAAAADPPAAAGSGRSGPTRRRRGSVPPQRARANLGSYFSSRRLSAAAIRAEARGHDALRADDRLGRPGDQLHGDRVERQFGARQRDLPDPARPRPLHAGARLALPPATVDGAPGRAPAR